ncbi:hypothetical protein ACMS1Z_00295 [Acidiphilium multivorum]|uniref:hypothetical protein n=1 Tax=Acidiphilium multivorum TaxID=62140 RepID=UPI0039C8EAA8
MFRGLLRSLLGTAPAVPAPSPLDYRAALARLEADAGRVNDALRQAFDRRRAALLTGDDAEVDRLDAVIDALGREQERAEILERELLARASKLPETFS